MVPHLFIFGFTFSFLFIRHWHLIYQIILWLKFGRNFECLWVLLTLEVCFFEKPIHIKSLLSYYFEISQLPTSNGLLCDFDCRERQWINWRSLKGILTWIIKTKWELFNLLTIGYFIPVASGTETNQRTFYPLLNTFLLLLYWLTEQIWTL